MQVERTCSKKGDMVLAQFSADNSCNRAMEAVDSYKIEKHARDTVETLQVSLSEELERSQQDTPSANKKIQSLSNTYKGLQEYNKKLQDYNTRLQKDLGTVNETLKRVETEKVAVVENLSGPRGHYTSLQEHVTSFRGNGGDQT